MKMEFVICNMNINSKLEKIGMNDLYFQLAIKDQSL